MESEIHTFHQFQFKFHTRNKLPLYEISMCARLHFDPYSLFKCVSKLYQFGGIADLAMHLCIKLPGKKNDTNLYYG